MAGEGDNVGGGGDVSRAGQRIALSSRRADRPNREFLEWHIDEVYKAS